MKGFLSGAARRMAQSEALVRPISMAADMFMRGRGCLMTFHRGARQPSYGSSFPIAISISIRRSLMNSSAI